MTRRRRRVARGIVAVLALGLVLVGVWKYSGSRTHQPFGESVSRVDTPVSELIEARTRPASTAADGPPYLRTDSTRYTLRPLGTGWSLNIGVEYRNERQDTIYIVHCNGHVLMNLQQRTSTGWTDAWHGMTNACLSPPLIIPPGATYSTSIVIWGAPAGETSTNAFLTEDFTGDFRLVWYQPVLHFDAQRGSLGDTLPLAQRTSNTFRLRHAPGNRNP